MRNYLNIDKCAFRKGEYIGYHANGHVYHIRKTNSSYGTWIAWPRDGGEAIYTFGLSAMSEALLAE